MGSMAVKEADARTVAESVSLVSHQMRAKRTRALPTREKAWPIQMAKKRGFQLLVSMGLSFIAGKMDQWRVQHPAALGIGG
jgi:hypothetical protein